MIFKFLGKISQRSVIKAIVYSAISTLLIKQAILFSTNINILSVEIFAPLVPLYDKLVSIFGFFYIALNNIIINLHFINNIFTSSIPVGLTINGAEPQAINISNNCDNAGEGSSKNAGGDNSTGGNSNNNKGTVNENSSTTSNPEKEKRISKLGEKISKLEERQQVLFHQLTDSSHPEVYQESAKEHSKNSKDIMSLINELDNLKLKNSDDSKLVTIFEISSGSEASLVTSSISPTPSPSPSPDLPYEGKGKKPRRD